MKKACIFTAFFMLLWVQLSAQTQNHLELDDSYYDGPLSGAIVKASNKRVKRMITLVDSLKIRNNPNDRSDFSCSVYSRMTLGLSNPRENLSGKRFDKELGFVFDYIDTSDFSGVPYLPVMISESTSSRYHTVSPKADKEFVSANKISGINPENNLLSQFSGSMYIKGDFYHDFVNLFGIDFPSPARKGSLLYYDYYIVDSLSIDSRKTYLIRFHPKPINEMSPILDGEMYVDATDWALRGIKARMVRGANVNWIRDLAVEMTYKPVADTAWFFDTQTVYADFSVQTKPGSEALSFIGNGSVVYYDPVFAPEPAGAAAPDRVTVAADASKKDDGYWADARPYALSQKEEEIYGMVDAIKDQPLYHDLYSLAYTLATGYFDFGNFGFGPYLRTLSYNNVEGFRAQVGFHTSKDLSQKWRASAYGAYGFGDSTFKGGAKYEQLFCKIPTSKLTLEASYDMCQLGKGAGAYTEGTILSSIWGNHRTSSPMSSFSALFEKEFNTTFNTAFEVKARRIYSNEYVPMSTWSGEHIRSVASNELHFMARFSKDEAVNRGYFTKTYLHTRYPVVSFDLFGAIPGLRTSDYGYIRPEVTLKYKFHASPAGIAHINFNAGTIIGKVPYQFLYLHPGNVTGMYDKTAFSTMDYFEFASDSWAFLSYEHNLGGFFLSKIPLLQHAQWREVVSLKAACGYLSDKNNGTSASFGAVMPFPYGMKPLKVPYVEAGAGISNILRIFRVEFFWRLTNLEQARRPFVVNFGIDMSF